MNLPSQAGRYIARPRKWAVAPTGPNKISTFVCEFDLLNVQDGEEWPDIAPEALEITGYFYILKKDGQPNDFTIDSLEAALGWDGCDLDALNKTDWSQKEVQLTINEEEYQGKKKMKVGFINARDWAGGGIEQDPQYVQSLAQKYGAVLRARKGVTAKPTTTPQKRSPSAGPREAAWEAFKAAHPSLDTAKRAAAWKEDLAKMFPGKKSEELTAQDWTKAVETFKNPVASALSPDGEIDPNEIPF